MPSQNKAYEVTGAITTPVAPERFTEDEAAIVADRDAHYGSLLINHTTAGMMWSGMINQHFQQLVLPPLPPDLVALMMAALKVNRLCRDIKHDDSLVDALNYLKIARTVSEQADEEAERSARTEGE